jgi:hypothetical protein
MPDERKKKVAEKNDRPFNMRLPTATYKGRRAAPQNGFTGDHQRRRSIEKALTANHV